VKHCPNAECEHNVRNGTAAEFLDEVSHCSDCGGDLIDGEAPAPEPMVYRDLVTVYEADRGVEAHLVKAAIETENIPVHISGEDLLGALGELPMTMQPVRVQVPPEFAERARELALECEINSEAAEEAD